MKNKKFDKMCKLVIDSPEKFMNKYSLALHDFDELWFALRDISKGRTVETINSKVKAVFAANGATAIPSGIGWIIKYTLDK